MGCIPPLPFARLEWTRVLMCILASTDARYSALQFWLWIGNLPTPNPQHLFHSDPIETEVR